MTSSNTVGPRQAGGLPSNASSRVGEIGSLPSRGSAEDRPTPSTSLGQGLHNGGRPWGANIWSSNGATSLLPNLGSSSIRETSRTREPSNFLPPTSESHDGKVGSGSLVASSESEAWGRHRTPWAEPGSGRSAGVSPVRPPKAVAGAAQPGQGYADASANQHSLFAPTSRAPGVNGLAKFPSSVKPRLDGPSAAHHSGASRHDPFANPFLTGFPGPLAGADAQGTRAAAEALTSNWNDTGSALHSPTDDRRKSITNSEYVITSSNGPSRSASASLPPSRQGGEPAQHNVDSFSTRFPPAPAQVRQPPFNAYRNGRAYQERSGSIQSDVIPMFSRFSFEGEENGPQSNHRPSSSIHSISGLNLGSHGFSHSHDHQTRDDFPSQPQLRQEDVQGFHGGSFTPNGLPQGQYHDTFGNYRNFQMNQRGAMTPSSTSDFRHSPYYSAGGTPAESSYDHLYPSGRESTSRAFANGLDKRLRNVQTQQQMQQFQQDQYLANQPLPPILAQQMRNPYSSFNYNLNNNNNLPMNMIAHEIHMNAVHGNATAAEPPRGPRDQDSGMGYRSAKLDDFKVNSKTKTFTLRDIYDHVVEFSGDQHGSRFIQQKLETANSDEKERVFNELKGDSLQLMQDVFGNYVIQKFFEHGDQNQKRFLADRMRGQVLQLSTQMYGCRVVQKALEHVLTDQQSALVRELHDQVMKCVKDQNGNHVIQKAIERVPAEHVQFIINDFEGQVGQLATHPYGCRVIQRMLEHCQEDARKSILAELHQCGPGLVTDQYGNYVAQHIIEHGSPDDRVKVIRLVMADLVGHSKHKFASNVVEKCLIFGSDEQRRDIMRTIVDGKFDGEPAMHVLVKDAYGNYVIQKLLDTLTEADYHQFMAALVPAVNKTRKNIPTKHYQAVSPENVKELKQQLKNLKQVEKKMHRFSKSDKPGESSHRGSLSTNASTSATPPTAASEVQSARSSPSTSVNTAESLREEPKRDDKKSLSAKKTEDSPSTDRDASK